MPGEHRLWQEVLLLAVNDVARSRSTREMATAVDWFRTQRCRDICFLLGRDPQELKQIVIDLAQRSPAQRRYWMVRIKKEMRKGEERSKGSWEEEEEVTSRPLRYHGS
jgi:hypothetical protein